MSRADQKMDLERIFRSPTVKSNQNTPFLNDRRRGKVTSELHFCNSPIHPPKHPEIPMQQSWEEIKQSLIDGENNPEPANTAFEETESSQEPPSEDESQEVPPVDRKSFYLQLAGFAAISTTVFSISIYFLTPAKVETATETHTNSSNVSVTDSVAANASNIESEPKVPDEDMIQF